jgi:hypothetical protein
VRTAQSIPEPRLGRRYVVPIGCLIFVGGVVVGFAAWNSFRHAEPFQSVRAGVTHDCSSVAAAVWSAGGKTGRTWVIRTNLASCDDVRAKVSALAGESIVGISEEPLLRCTAAAIVGGQVLSGICYIPASSQAFFAWGASIWPYNLLGPCQTCSGVPGENVSEGSSTTPVAEPQRSQ